MSVDLVIEGASVFTGREHRPGWSVAVARGRIVAVGPSDRVGELAGRGTRMVRVPGGMVVPGFQDAHTHPNEGGLVRTQANLHDLPTVAAYAEAIRAYAQGHPDRAWVLGGGWAQPLFARGCPSKDILDVIAPDRPVFLPNRDGHGAWVNSRALAIAGVTRDTPDPPDGRIERESDRSPQGTLHEGAMGLVERCIPSPTQHEWEQSLLAAQRYLHSLGITAWQDAWVTEQTLSAYRALAERGALTARVVAALWWDRHRGEEQIEELVELRRWGGIGRLDAGSVKIMQDGIAENFTAGMLEPYLEPEGRRGLSFLEPSLLRAAVSRLDAEAFQVHIHAIGDRAVREALDAFEAARTASGGADRRHHLAHLQVVHPDDLPRFGRLGVVANIQPYWACFDDQMLDLTVDILGPQRVGHQYPFGALARSGATLAMGSDWPVSTPECMKEIQVAVTRIPFDRQDRGALLPEERLTLAEALRAFTLGSAFVNRLEGDTGSIEEGKLADVAVLDRDPFGLPPNEIGRAKVVLTLVDGQPVFEDTAAGLD
jgi:predicted amidohydrolase YtcJ